MAFVTGPGGEEWQVAQLDPMLGHGSDPVELNPPSATPERRRWYAWVTEYPEEGSVGPFASKADALAWIAAAE